MIVIQFRAETVIKQGKYGMCLDILTSMRLYVKNQAMDQIITARWLQIGRFVWLIDWLIDLYSKCNFTGRVMHIADG